MRPWLLLLPVVTLASAAQNNPTAKSGGGTLTGHVYCADTNAPARMATVQLKPVKDVEARSGAHPHSTSDEPASGVVQTTLDGSFAIPNVVPGSYYVVVTAAGYLLPRDHNEDDEDTDDAEPKPPAGQPPIVIPKVAVEADQAPASTYESSAAQP